MARHYCFGWNREISLFNTRKLYVSLPFFLFGTLLLIVAGWQICNKFRLERRRRCKMKQGERYIIFVLFRNGQRKKQLTTGKRKRQEKVLKNDENYNGVVCAAGRSLAATTKGSYLLEAL